MVRKGSPVRVRQRDARTGPALAALCRSRHARLVVQRSAARPRRPCVTPPTSTGTSTSAERRWTRGRDGLDELECLTACLTGCATNVPRPALPTKNPTGTGFSYCAEED